MDSRALQAGAVGRHGLLKDDAGDGRMLLKIGGKLLVDDGVDEGADIGVAELGLGLALELGVRQLHGDDSGQALAAVLAGDLVGVGLDDAGLRAVGVEHAGQGRFEARLVHAALRRVDVIGKRDDGLVIAVVVLQGDLGLGVAADARHIDDLLVQGRLVAVVPEDELADTALVAHGIGRAVLRAAVGDLDAQAGVQEGLLAHTGVERLVVIDEGVEHLGVGLEGDDGAVLVRIADDAHFLRDIAAGELHLIDLALFMDLDREPLGKGVDDGRADAVQAAGDLIAAAAEFAARMQDRIDDLERGAAGLGLNVHGDAAAVIGDGDGVAGVDRHGNVGAVAREGLVDGVVHDLIDEMVQAAGGRRADIHARTFPDGLQPLKDLDL